MGSRPRRLRETWAKNTNDPCFETKLKALIETYKANKEIFSNADGWDAFKKDIKNMALEISTKRRL